MSDDKDQQQMRDARLKKALDSAPDAAERPADSVRAGILYKARLTAAAAAAPAARPERRRGWLGLRSWNPALATLGAVVFVSVSMWNVDWQQAGQEPVAQAPVRSEPASAPLETVQPAPAADASPRPAAAPALKPPPRRLAEEAPAEAQRRRSDAADRAERVARIKQAVERRALAAKAEAEAPAQAAPPPPVVAMAPPQPAPLPAPVVPAPAPTAPPPPAPAPIVADIAARAAQGRAAASESLRESFNVAGSAVAPTWLSLRFLVTADTVLIQRSEVPVPTMRLLSTAMRLEGQPGETFDEAADLRVELMARGERPIGLLELGPTALRWTPTGQPPRVSRPALLGELRTQLLAALAAARAGKPMD